jgi:hypothetical protein
VAGLIGWRALAALRVGATLAHQFPIRLRLRVADTVMIEVARCPGPRSAALSPCRFRAEVVRAWGLARAGRPVAMRGLPVGTEPSIDLGLPPGGASRPGGLWRVTTGGRTAWVAGVVCPPTRLWVAAEPGISLRVDEGTGVVVVTGIVDEPDDEPVVIDTLEGLVATLTVHALVADVAAAGE